MRLASESRSQAMSIHQLLRGTTAAAHAHIEKNTLLARLLAADLELTEYADILLGLQRFYCNFEAHLEAENGVHDDLAGYQYRSRLPLLNHDLFQLSNMLPSTHALNTNFIATTATDLSLQYSLPSLTSPSQQLGALYVIEGSSQGGKMISKRVTHKFPNAANITAYFNYWQLSPDSWLAWQRCAENQQFNSAQEQAAVDSAISTFLAIEHALPQRRHG